MEAVKVRIQTQPGWANNLREGVPKLWAEEGIRGYVVTKINATSNYMHRSWEVTKKLPLGKQLDSLFTLLNVFAFKTRGGYGDSVLISSLSSCSNDRCSSNMCTNCTSQWQAILLPVWFDNWMVLFNMFFYLLSFSRFYKGLPPLWMRQIPYTMMKFACFERTVEFLYKNVVPKPRSVTHCLWWHV